MLSRLIAFAAATVLTVMAPAASAAPSYSVRVWARVPAPGHANGIVVGNGRVVASTDAGSPIHPNTQGERVFTFDTRGRLTHAAFVDEGPVSMMGLAGMAFDGRGRLYVVDMNNVVTRYARDGSKRAWASAPMPYTAGMYWTCMWTDIDFDAHGNAYIPDSIASNPLRIWRITPDGTVSIWYEETAPMNGGPFQAQIDATGRYLYFVRVVQSDKFGAGVLYRLPLKEHPQPGDLQEVHRFPTDSSDLTRTVNRSQWFVGPQTNGVALGRSGRIYVAVSNRNAIAVLDKNGKLLRMISSPLLNYPTALAFLGNKLLVANADFHETDHPEKWTIASIDVGDTEVKPFLPRNIR